MVAVYRVGHGPTRARIGNEYRRTLERGLAFGDTIVLIAAFGVASLVALHDGADIPFGEFLAIRIELGNVGIFAAWLAVWRLTLVASGLYETRPASWARGLLVLALANAVNAGLIAATAELFQLSIVSPSLLATFWVCATAGMLALRGLAALLFPDVGRVRYVLVVGTSERARRYAERLADDPDHNRRLVGFCDEEQPARDELEGGVGPCVTDFKNFPEYLKSNVIDEVVICVPAARLARRDCPVLPACETLGVTVRFLSSTFSELGIEKHDDVIMTVYNGLVEGSSLMFKRALDVSVAAVLLVLAAPLLLVLAGLIRLDSKGPIFFKQVRVGLNKRPFKMYKLRTMCEDAELMQSSLEFANEVDGAAFKIGDDPRTTRVGRYLRRSSLDELPQLLNVLRGEMSLVGPRPLPLRDFARFDMGRHGRRFGVYPGLTGLWQVSGRSSLSFSDWMELDLQYVDRWSVLLDLELLLRTIPAVVLRIGAR